MKILYIIIACIFSLQVASAQGIRKNYLEMTDIERSNLVNAFYQMRLGGDLINNIATFHATFFNFDGTADPTRLDIHFNLPDEPEREVFLAWHRQVIFELEQAMQDINPYITIPFWRSSTDQSLNSPLWDQNFLGQFDADWNLQRDLGGTDQLPFPSEVNSAQRNTNFFLYSDEIERGPVHHGAHRWVGGAMLSTASPRDPVFFLHHAFVDMLWDEWTRMGNSSSYQRTNMLRYDGTFSFNGRILPSVNPNSIINSRALGIFYADGQQARLDNYTVTNTNSPDETFFYRYNITAGNNFVINSGRRARIESQTRIVLQPGFRANAGSNFIASINIGPTLRDYIAITRNQIPWDNIPVDPDAFDDQIIDSENEEVNLKVYPNPFNAELNILTKNSDGEMIVELYDLTGRKLIERNYSGVSTVVIDNLSNLIQGSYMLRITIDGKEVLSRPIIKR